VENPQFWFRKSSHQLPFRRRIKRTFAPSSFQDAQPQREFPLCC